MVDQLALDELGTALLALRAPWTVLRDAEAAEGGNDFGASFVALHPEKGIALVDLAPARSNANIPWLRILLIHAGGGVFTLREPPIVAVRLSPEEIPKASTRIEAAFAEMPPCEIVEGDWPIQAIAALAAGNMNLMPLTPRGRSNFKPKRASTSDALKPANARSRAAEQKWSEGPPALSASPAAVPAEVPADELAPAHGQRSPAREAFPLTMRLRLNVPRIEAPTPHLLRMDIARIALPPTFIAVPEIRLQQAESLSPRASRSSAPASDLPQPTKAPAPEAEAPVIAAPIAPSAEALRSRPSEASPRDAISAGMAEDADPVPIDPRRRIGPEIGRWRTIGTVMRKRTNILYERVLHARLPSLRERLGTLKIRIARMRVLMRKRTNVLYDRVLHARLPSLRERLGTLEIRIAHTRVLMRKRTNVLYGRVLHARLPSLRERLGTLEIRIARTRVLRVIREEWSLALRSSAAFVLTRGPPRWARMAPWAALALVLGVLSPSAFHMLDSGKTAMQSSSKEPPPQALPIWETESVAPPEEAMVQPPILQQPAATPPNAKSDEKPRTRSKSEPSDKMSSAPGMKSASRDSAPSVTPGNTTSKIRVREKARPVWERLATRRTSNADPYDGPEYDYANRQTW